MKIFKLIQTFCEQTMKKAEYIRTLKSVFTASFCVHHIQENDCSSVNTVLYKIGEHSTDDC